MYSVLVCVILNVKIFCTLNSIVLARPFVSHFQSPLYRLIILSYVELGNLFLSLLTTSSNHSIHPQVPHRGLALDGSIWVPSIQFMHVGVSAICPGGVTSLNLCITFVCQERWGGGVYHFVLTVCGDWHCLFFVFCASWLNDSCAVPLTFSSLLFVFSPSLPSCFCSFFRTNLHACLLIISLACLHDVDSQAKLLASSSHHCL